MVDRDYLKQTREAMPGIVRYYQDRIGDCPVGQIQLGKSLEIAERLTVALDEDVPSVDALEEIATLFDDPLVSGTVAYEMSLITNAWLEWSKENRDGPNKEIQET